MSRCPFCDYETPEPDGRDRVTPGWQEVAHMTVAHPDVIERRLLDNGFLRDSDGTLFDILANGD